MVYGRRRKATRYRRGTRAAFRKATGRYRSRRARLGRFSRRRVDRAQAKALVGQSLQLKALRAAVLPPMKKLAEAEFEASSLRAGYLNFKVAHFLQLHAGYANGEYGETTTYYTKDKYLNQTTNEMFAYAMTANNHYDMITESGDSAAMMCLFNALGGNGADVSRDAEVLECRRPLIYEPVSLLELAGADRRDSVALSGDTPSTQYNWRENRRVGDVHCSGSFYINMRQGTEPNWSLDEKEEAVNNGGEWPGNELPSVISPDGRGNMGRFIGADPFDPQYVRATAILVWDMGDGTGVTGLEPDDVNSARLFASASGQSYKRHNYTSQGGFMGSAEYHRYAPSLGELYDDLEWDQAGNNLWPCWKSGDPDLFEPRGASLCLEDTDQQEGQKDNYNGVLTYDVMRAPIRRRQRVVNYRPGRGTVTLNANHASERDYVILDYEGVDNVQSTTNNVAAPQYSVDPYQKGYMGRSFKVLYDKVIKFAPGDRGGQSGHGNARDQAEIKYSWRLPDNIYPLDAPNSTKRFVNGARWRVFWYFTASCSPFIAGQRVHVNTGTAYDQTKTYTGLHEFRVARGSEKVSWREKP